METKKSDMEIKLDIYKTLYEKYRLLANSFMSKAHSAKEYNSSQERKLELLEFMGDFEKYSYAGIIHKEDILIIKTLEKMLGTRNLPDEVK